MAKTLTIILTILGIIILLGAIVGGVWYFTHLGAKGTVDKVESTSDDGVATLSAEFYTLSGDQPTSGISQALIGGTSKRTHVKFQLKGSNTGNVPLTNVKPTAPNINMDGAFDNVVPLSTLSVGATNIIIGSTDQSCTASAQCNTNEECCNIGTGICGTVTGQCLIKLNNYASGTSLNNVDFVISLTGDFLNALGQTQSTTSLPVTLTYDIRAETCTDGTTINSCVFSRTGVDADKPKYCNFIEGTAPSIINKASSCGCPVGYSQNGENCVINTCADGTAINSCSIISHEGTYGAYYFCKSDQTYETRCNQCGATTDAYNNPKTGCSSPTDPSSAVYQTYTGGLSGSITE